MHSIEWLLVYIAKLDCDWRILESLYFTAPSRINWAVWDTVI